MIAAALQCPYVPSDGGSVPPRARPTTAIPAGGATCPVGARDKDARLELKTRTDHAEAQKTENEAGTQSANDGRDPVNCELLVSFELAASRPNDAVVRAEHPRRAVGGPQARVGLEALRSAAQATRSSRR